MMMDKAPAEINILEKESSRKDDNIIDSDDIVHACNKVQLILDQVIHHDAPPVNDLGETFQELKSIRSNHGADMSFLDHSALPTNSTELAGASSFESDGSSEPIHFLENLRNTDGSSPAVDYRRLYEHYAHQQVKLGHAGLATLCRWTIDHLITASARPPDTLEIETQHLMDVNIPESPNNKSTRSPASLSSLGKMRFFGCSKKKRLDGELTVPDTQFFRLQMFGSEYARYLSKCQLAAPRSQRSRQRVRLPAKSAMNIEDTPDAIQTGPLTDLILLGADETPPHGFFRLTLTAAGHRATLHRNKKLFYLAVKKEPDWDKAVQRPCITAITVIYPDRGEFVPPGFSIVKRLRQESPFHLGMTERILLAFRRSREGNPITGLLLLAPDKGEKVPIGFTVVEKSPRNFTADLQKGSGPALFLAYRQRLACLECLRPLPLVASVKNEGGERHLKSYFATGGTIIHSDVGRFHVMDRSSHKIHSSSSVANRLKLIESSRQQAANAINMEVELTPLSERESNHGTIDYANEEISVGDSSNTSGRNFASPIDVQKFQGWGKTTPEERSGFSSFVWSFPKTPNLAMVYRPYYAIENSELSQNLDALSFIPSIESISNDGDRLSSRVAAITPILTACYIRHGGSAQIAVDALTDLLDGSTFFYDDVDVSDDVDNESCHRFTLLDLAVQVVCDLASGSAQETMHASCVEFIEKAVRFAQGQLNTRTIGYIVRCYLFVFFFGASTSSKWPNPLWYPPLKEGERSYPMLYDQRREAPGTCYLPGGAPQAAALGLKDLVSLSLIRLGKVSVYNLLLLARSSQERNSPLSEGSAEEYECFHTFLQDLLGKAVDDSVDLVDRANYTQLALHQIHKSGGSELFWHDMVNVCGAGLFGKEKRLGEVGRDVHILVFGILSNLVKVASGKISPDLTSKGLLPRDKASKLLSLELILHFLEYWSDELEAMSDIGNPSLRDDFRTKDTLAYAVRRIVIPCLLWNTKAGLQEPEVYCRILRILSEIWCSPIYRNVCKVELGILFDHFALRLLQLGPQALTSYDHEQSSDRLPSSLIMQQLELLLQIKTWFSADPKDVIELYLNYDTDISTQLTGPIQLMSGTQSRTFQRLCAGLSNLAEQCGEFICHQIRQNQMIVGRHGTKVFETHSESRDESIKVDKFRHMAARDAVRKVRKNALEAICQIVKSLAISAAASIGTDFSRLIISWTSIDLPVSKSISSDEESSSILSDNENERGDVVHDPIRSIIDADDDDSVGSIEESITTAIEIANKKSLKKAVEYLIACNTLTSAPRDIASFLHLHKDSLDPADLGYYLGESGVGGAEVDYWNAIRYAYIRSLSFIGMDVERGLRHFLQHAGFRLPGEAQKIDRILETFSQCYFEDNAGDGRHCPFKNHDTVYLLSFAIIMLNTDLHNTATARKGKKKMTKPEFINNLRGAEQGESIDKDYLSRIYDSIECQGITIHGSSEDLVKENFSGSMQDMLSNVRNADSLLRGLSVHDFRFTTIADVTTNLDRTSQNTLYKLARSCVSKTWYQWLGVINTGLDAAYLDPQGLEPCVEILLFALSITICLDLPLERAAFIGQLARLRAFEERRHGKWIPTSSGSTDENLEWQVNLEEACCSERVDRKLWALCNVAEMIQSLRATLLIDFESKIGMTAAVADIKDGSYLLNDPARAFLRSGDLSKKSNRTGRLAKYRFYLFSDVLLYASISADGQYVVHDELPIHLVKIVDWFPPSQKGSDNMFEVHHPRKSFLVICSSVEERKSWVSDIRHAFSKEMERKMKVEAARMALFQDAHNK